MFDEKNIDRNDQIGKRFAEIKGQVLPPPELEKAVTSGAPYGKRVRTAIHIKRFTKAVTAYVVGIALLLGVLFLLPRLFAGREPVGSDPMGGTPVLTSLPTFTASAPQTTTIPSTTAQSPITEPVPETTTTASSLIESTPVTTTVAPETGDAPVTEEAAKDCFVMFAGGLASVGKSITISRELTAEELSKAEAFLISEDVRDILSAAWFEPFYRPEDVHLFEILCADNTNIISEEEAILLKGDPNWIGDWSRMTTDEIKSMAKQYLGIEVTQAMLDAMLEEQVYLEGEITAAGAVYLAEYDAYYRHHTDAGGMYPFRITGWLTEDGKLLLHYIANSSETGDHGLVLLNPAGDSYWIEAVQEVDAQAVCDPVSPLSETMP